jgi:hypothetical protein
MANMRIIEDDLSGQAIAPLQRAKQHRNPRFGLPSVPENFLPNGGYLGRMASPNARILWASVGFGQGSHSICMTRTL